MHLSPVILVDLAEVAEGKHENSAYQELPETGSANLAIRGLDDQVELNHLERHGDGPINVAVDNGAGMNGNPVLTHVHVVDGCNQGDQSSDVDRSLPVTNDGARLRVQEDRCCNHCDGDDPE